MSPLDGNKEMMRYWLAMVELGNNNHDSTLHPRTKKLKEFKPGLLKAG